MKLQIYEYVLQQLKKGILSQKQIKSSSYDIGSDLGAGRHRHPLQ